MQKTSLAADDLNQSVDQSIKLANDECSRAIKSIKLANDECSRAIKSINQLVFTALAANGADMEVDEKYQGSVFTVEWLQL